MDLKSVFLIAFVINLTNVSAVDYDASSEESRLDGASNETEQSEMHKMKNFVFRSLVENINETKEDLPEKASDTLPENGDKATGDSGQEVSSDKAVNKTGEPPDIRLHTLSENVNGTKSDSGEKLLPDKATNDSKEQPVGRSGTEDVNKTLGDPEHKATTSSEHQPEKGSSTVPVNVYEAKEDTEEKHLPDKSNPTKPPIETTLPKPPLQNKISPRLYIAAKEGPSTGSKYAPTTFAELIDDVADIILDTPDLAQPLYHDSSDYPSDYFDSINDDYVLSSEDYESYENPSHQEDYFEFLNNNIDYGTTNKPRFRILDFLGLTKKDRNTDFGKSRLPPSKDYYELLNDISDLSRQQFNELDVVSFMVNCDWIFKTRNWKFPPVIKYPNNEREEQIEDCRERLKLIRNAMYV